MKQKKSLAKANGLKSTFLLGDDHVYMTSFGKGASAEPEKDIRHRVVKDLKKTFTAADLPESTGFAIHGRAGDCEVQVSERENLLHAADVIETIYFGKPHEDNIHIQIAYNIMDIQKLLASYAAIVVQTVNNMDRDRGAGDFLGTFKTQNNYALSKAVHQVYQLGLLERAYPNGGFEINRDVWASAQNRELRWLSEQVRNYEQANRKRYPKGWSPRVISDYLVSHGIRSMNIVRNMDRNWINFQNFCRSAKDSAYYFGEAFTDEKGEFSEEKTFALLRVLGEFRQNTMHGAQMGDNRLFHLEERADAETRQLLDGFLDEKISKLNSTFCETNRVNLAILHRVYPQTPMQELVREYYDFSVRKEFKNLGISVKKLREQMLTLEDAKVLTEQRYDTVRAKLYSLMDFVIDRTYRMEEKQLLRLVGACRSARTEEQKDEIYRKEALRLWKQIRHIVLNQIKPCMNATEIKKLNRTAPKSVEQLEENMQKPQDLSLFSKAVYVFSLFLDSKEINMLLGGLVNELENIQSFVDTLKQLKLDVDFSPRFTFFEYSGAMAKELQLIQSIARMNKGKKAKKDSEVTIKRCQYMDAAAVFGETDPQRVAELYQLDKQGSDSRTADHSLRNFMINTVINNNRFVYVVRFMNPKDARAIMQCRPLVEFVLHELPEAQLKRYCDAVHCPVYEGKPEKTAQGLAELLLEVQFDQFRSVKQKVRQGTEEAMQKERYKAVVSLYLTVLYQIVKTMVRINARYMMAFGLLERDLELYRRKIPAKPFYMSKLESDGTFSYHADQITLEFQKRGWLNPRVLKSIRTNAAYYRGDTFKAYRNQVEHMQVLTHLPAYAKHIHRVKSMFDVYHCVLLDALLDAPHNGVNEQTKHTARENMERYNTVWKDFLYGLNTPFAYNAARYINLSNREKFLEGYGK